MGNLLEQGVESDSRLVLPITLYLSSARLWNEDKDSQSGMEIPDRTEPTAGVLMKNVGYSAVQLHCQVEGNIVAGKSRRGFPCIHSDYGRNQMGHER